MFVFGVVVDPPTDRTATVCDVAILVRETSGRFSYHQLSHSKTHNSSGGARLYVVSKQQQRAIIYLYCIYLLVSFNPDWVRVLYGAKRIIKYNSG